MLHQISMFPSVTTCALFAALVIGGCGRTDDPTRGPVAGTVTVDGTPLKSGVIRFVPSGETRGPAAVARITDGTYQLGEDEGPVVGAHRVEIEAIDYMDIPIDDEQAQAKRAAQGLPLPKNPIPEIYNRRSSLTAQIPAEGNRRLDFRLEATARAAIGVR